MTFNSFVIFFAKELTERSGEQSSPALQLLQVEDMQANNYNFITSNHKNIFILKFIGGDPSAGSPTDTL